MAPTRNWIAILIMILFLVTVLALLAVAIWNGATGQRPWDWVYGVITEATKLFVFPVVMVVLGFYMGHKSH